MSFTPDEIDSGADALRRYEQGGKMLRMWDDLPTATKKKWREKVGVVLSAVEREAQRVEYNNKLKD